MATPVLTPPVFPVSLMSVPAITVMRPTPWTDSAPHILAPPWVVSQPMVRMVIRIESGAAGAGAVHIELTLPPMSTLVVA